MTTIILLFLIVWISKTLTLTGLNVVALTDWFNRHPFILVCFVLCLLSDVLTEVLPRK